MHGNNETLLLPVAEEMARILDVVIISGPLGSGKTTLADHILENSNFFRFAFIKLNLGDASTDTKLLQTKNNAHILSGQQMQVLRFIGKIIIITQ